MPNSTIPTLEYLPDVLEKDLRVVFCGMAPGKTSAKQRAYYARDGNKFWRILHETKLTARELRPDEYPLLLKEGIGLTDLFKDQCGMDKDIDLSRFEGGRDRFREKILSQSPRVLAFTSKNVASVYFGVSCRKIEFGLQGGKLDFVKLFVLPSPSPANNRNWKKDDHGRVWHQLANFLRSS